MPRLAGPIKKDLMSLNLTICQAHYLRVRCSSDHHLLLKLDDLVNYKSKNTIEKYLSSRTVLNGLGLTWFMDFLERSNCLCT